MNPDHPSAEFQPECPVPRRASLVLASGTEPVEAMRRLRRCLVPCNRCERLAACAFQQEFNRTVKQVLCQVSASWSQGVGTARSTPTPSPAGIQALNPWREADMPNEEHPGCGTPTEANAARITEQLRQLQAQDQGMAELRPHAREQCASNHKLR